MRLLRLAVGVATAFVLSLTTAGALTPAAASASPAPAVGLLAYETNYAVAGTPNFDGCADNTYTVACFEKYGDRWWVGLHVSSGRAEWRNELWNGSKWVLYREGSCISNLGAQTWGACNKDYYENSSVNAYGYRGSRLWWRACDSTCSSWVWDYNDQ